MPDNKFRCGLPSPTASTMGCDLSVETRSFAPRSLRMSESRVTMRRRLASIRVGTQRRRYQRIATEDRRLPDLNRPTQEPSPVIAGARNRA